MSDKIISENTRKLRYTFSRIVPNLKIGNGIVVFLDDKTPTLRLYSLQDGDLVYQKVIAKEIISVLMHLKVKNIPWNNVDRQTLNQIIKSFDHINKEETQCHEIPDDAIIALRNELKALFE